MPPQMPILRVRPSDYPYFCSTWLQIGGFHEPLPGCSHFLEQLEERRSTYIYHFDCRIKVMIKDADEPPVKTHTELGRVPRAAAPVPVKLGSVIPLTPRCVR